MHVNGYLHASAGLSSSKCSQRLLRRLGGPQNQFGYNVEEKNPARSKSPYILINNDMHGIFFCVLEFTNMATMRNFMSCFEKLTQSGFTDVISKLNLYFLLALLKILVCYRFSSNFGHVKKYINRSFGTCACFVAGVQMAPRNVLADCSTV
jgi:hypothetical protein